MSTITDARFAEYAAQAGLSDIQRMCAEMWLEGAPYGKICRALNLSRHQVRCALYQAADKLSRVAPDFWEPGRQFPRDLMLCVGNRPVLDDYELPGVTPDTSTLLRAPQARVMTADDPILQQRPDDCLRHWARELAAVSA